MKIVSWNVNGLRAVLSKNFYEFAKDMDADVICLQETKMQEGQAEVLLEGYEKYWNSAVKKGYSGTAIFTRVKPLSVKIGLDEEIHNQEGRVLTMEFEEYFVVCCYTPNSKDKLARIDYRMEWEDYFRNYLLSLDAVKPVILCGDLNVAHNEIDLKNPKTNHFNAGFSDEERGKMSELLESGFKDTFRVLHGDEVKYSWWSYRFNSRANNAGWRIDYFIVSNRLMPAVKSAEIHNDVMGSDHCPVSIEI